MDEYSQQFFIIHDWMLSNELNLKGLKRDIFAIIHGFTHDNRTWFYGSHTYLANRLNVTLQAVGNCLKELRDNNYVLYKTENEGSVIHYNYMINYDKIMELLNKNSVSCDSIPVKESLTASSVKDSTPVKQSLTAPVKQSLTAVKESLTAPVKQSLTNNKYINKNNIKNKNNKFFDLSDQENFPSETTSNVSTTSLLEENEQNGENIKGASIYSVYTPYITKNKVIQNEKPAVGIDSLVSEKLTDIDNEQAKQNKSVKETKEKEKTVKNKKGKNSRKIKRALTVLKEFTLDEDITSSITDYLDILTSEGKTIPNEQRWRKILTTLFGSDLTKKDRLEMIRISSEAAYLTFYLPKNNSYNYNSNKVGLHVDHEELTSEETELSDLEF